MTSPVRVLPEAEADIAAAYAWYEEIQRGLGDRFLESILEAITFVKQSPLASHIVHADLRRTLVPRFPYSLFYLPEAGDLIVLGCFHARRDPSVWKRREEEHRDG